MLRCYLPSHVHALRGHRGVLPSIYTMFDDATAVRADRMCTVYSGVLKCSVWISNMLNMNKCNAHKQKFFRIVHNFKTTKLLQCTPWSPAFFQSFFSCQETLTPTCRPLGDEVLLALFQLPPEPKTVWGWCTFPSPLEVWGVTVSPTQCKALSIQQNNLTWFMTFIERKGGHLTFLRSYLSPSSWQSLEWGKFVTAHFTGGKTDTLETDGDVITTH